MSISMLLLVAIFNGAQVDWPGWDVNYTKQLQTSTKASWCGQQITSCVTVCYTSAMPTPLTNTCDSDVLAYNCICGDGVVPKLDIFTATIPYFQCTQILSVCQQNCAGTANEQSCKAGCLDKYQCPSLQASAAARVPINGTSPIVGINSAARHSSYLAVVAVFMQ